MFMTLIARSLDPELSLKKDVLVSLLESGVQVKKYVTTYDLPNDVATVTKCGYLPLGACTFELNAAVPRLQRSLPDLSCAGSFLYALCRYCSHY